MQVHPGLGAVPDVLVLPHYGEPRSAVVDRVLAKVDEAMTVLGIPACSGVLYDDGEPLALGDEDCWRFVAGREPAIIPYA
jgi:hypothetical protein